MPIVSYSEVIDCLEVALHALVEASAVENIIPNDDDTASAIPSITDLCNDVEHQAGHIKRIAAHQRRTPTTNQMTSFIAREIIRKERTVRKSVSISGGAKAKALRLAEGKCELCGRERDISVHDIIPRAEGGLPEAENYIVLCEECHNDVEDQGYHTREEVLLHSGRSILIKAQSKSKQNDDLTRSEKAAATRAKNEAEERKEEIALAEWDRWAGMFGRCVGYFPLGTPEVPRPEKPWHVAVYGAGRHANIARE